MNNIVLDTIKRYDLITKGDSVIVGVSGGTDSISLLHFLYSLKEDLGISVAALHINHGLRGSESDEDERYVADFCSGYGIDMRSVSVDVASYSARHKISIEEAGREERYRIFEEIAVSGGFTKVALGHNLDDRAETVLLNLIRGTGPDGLVGMPYKRGRIIRPLLDTRRSLTEEYCRMNALNPRTDSSNNSRRYSRNKVRLDLIPYINHLFGTDIVNKLYSMSRLVREDGDYLEEAAETAYECVASSEGNETALDISRLSSYHPSIVKRVFRLAIKRSAGTLKGISGLHLDAVMKLMCKSRTGSSVCLPAGMKVSVSYGMLRFVYGAEPVCAPARHVILNIPGITESPDFGIMLEASVEEVSAGGNDHIGIQQRSPEQYFDYPAITEGIKGINCLWVRGRKQGDRFKPFGSKYTRQLKKYLIDKKIPREYRDAMPLVTCGSEVLWIIGHMISDKFKTTENTKMLLRLKVRSTSEAAEKGGSE